MGLIEAEGAVARMVNSGATLGTIEDHIDEIPDLDSLARAELWLYAWSHQGGEARTVLLHYAESGRGGDRGLSD
jgi:hypothetical protein